MKRTGTILMLLGAGTFLAVQLTLGGSYDQFSLAGIAQAVSGLIMMAGIVLVIVSSARRIWRGETKLRPWDAARLFPQYFVLFVIGSCVAKYIGWSDKSFIEIGVYSLLFSVVFAFSHTAYRKFPS